LLDELGGGGEMPQASEEIKAKVRNESMHHNSKALIAARKQRMATALGIKIPDSIRIASLPHCLTVSLFHCFTVSPQSLEYFVARLRIPPQTVRAEECLPTMKQGNNETMKQ
jgi:hypothetical protein